MYAENAVGVVRDNRDLTAKVKRAGGFLDGVLLPASGRTPLIVTPVPGRRIAVDNIPVLFVYPA